MTGRRRGRAVPAVPPVGGRAGTGATVASGPAGARRVRGASRAPGARGVRGAPADRGAVTAELAIGLVAVTVVVLALLATGTATLTRLTCLDAARTGARVAALGEPDAVAVGAARRVLAGRGGQVDVRRADGWVTVTVSTPVTGWAAGLRARATATAWAEP